MPTRKKFSHKNLTAKEKQRSPFIYGQRAEHTLAPPYKHPKKKKNKGNTTTQ